MEEKESLKVRTLRTVNGSYFNMLSKECSIRKVIKSVPFLQNCKIPVMQLL